MAFGTVVQVETVAEQVVVVVAVQVAGIAVAEQVLVETEVLVA